MSDNELIDKLNETNIDLVLELDEKKEEIEKLQNKIDELKQQIKDLKDEVIHVTIDRFDDYELRHRFQKMQYELYIKGRTKNSRKNKIKKGDNND